MFGIKKHKVLIWSAIISASSLISCTSTSLDSKVIAGDTQGTTYRIIIVDDKVDVSKSEIDSLFHSFDLSLSTYVPNSTVSALNNAIDSIKVIDETGFFKRCYNLSQEVFKSTSGYFDPSVFPLVEGWGFMKNLETPLNQTEVDSLLTFVDFNPGNNHVLSFNNDEISLHKMISGFKMDFNAVAQGLSVDVVDDFLKTRGYKNYYIEIGGELLVRGFNREREQWKIGIDSPIENSKSRKLENVLQITNKAIATSGNYRKFYEIDGVKYAHSLNPKTGFPVQHSLLSVTVISDNCAKSDALATAFMVMGVEKTLDWLKLNNDVDAYLIYDDGSGGFKREMSKGFEKYLN